MDNHPADFAQLAQLGPIALELVTQRVPGSVVQDGDARLNERHVCPQDVTVRTPDHVLDGEVEAGLPQDHPRARFWDRFGARVCLGHCRPHGNHAVGMADARPLTECVKVDQAGPRCGIQVGGGQGERVPSCQVEAEPDAVHEPDAVKCLAAADQVACAANADPPDSWGRHCERNGHLDVVVGSGEVEPQHRGGRSAGDQGRRGENEAGSRAA